MGVVLITGGARGIGYDLTEGFLKEGYEVLCHYYKGEKEALALQKKHPKLELYQGDLRKKEAVKKMMGEIERKHGKLDVLINNAGISQYGLLRDITEEEWDTLFDTNVKSMFLCCKYGLPMMIGEKRGQIINISSVWGIVGASCEVGYSATKGAIIAFSKGLAKEVAPSGIRVNVIAPGAVNTGMMDSFTPEEKQQIVQEIPMGKIGEGKDIFQTALFLASDKGGYYTGQVFSPNGGWVIT